MRFWCDLSLQCQSEETVLNILSNTSLFRCPLAVRSVLKFEFLVFILTFLVPILSVASQPKPRANEQIIGRWLRNRNQIFDKSFQFFAGNQILNWSRDIFSKNCLFKLAAIFPEYWNWLVQLEWFCVQLKSSVMSKKSSTCLFFYFVVTSKLSFFAIEYYHRYFIKKR